MSKIYSSDSVDTIDVQSIAGWIVIIASVILAVGIITLGGYIL